MKPLAWPFGTQVWSVAQATLGCQPALVHDQRGRIGSKAVLVLGRERLCMPMGFIGHEQFVAETVCPTTRAWTSWP